MAGSMTLAELLLKLKVDDKEARASMDKIKTDAKDAGKQVEGSFSSMVGGIKVGSLAAIASVSGVIMILKKCVDEASEAEQATAKLAAVLKATGAESWTTTEELSKMAKQLQATTTFSDEMIMSGQAVLLRFREIGEKTLPRATEAMLDMASTMDKDVAGAALVLGKALQAPEKASGILFRAGVVLSNQQEDQIKTWVALGQQGKAHKIILDEIANTMGGTAAAMANTYAGRMAQLGNAVGELAETLGKFLLPALTGIVQALTWMVNGINSVIEASADAFAKYGQYMTGGQGLGGPNMAAEAAAVKIKTESTKPKPKSKMLPKSGGGGKVTTGTAWEAMGLPSQKEVFDEFISFSSQTLSMAQSTFSGMSEVLNMYYANKSIAIDNDLRHQMDAIQTAYDAEKKAIEDSLMNKKQKTAALEALDEKRARQEKKALEKSEKEKRKIARETAKYNKAFGIIDTTMNTAMAIMAAWRYAMEWGGPAAPAIGAGLTAMLGALGAAKVALIASQPLPEFARGGLFTGPAIVAEKGREVALPLEGDEGRAAMREMAGAMLDMISTRLDTGATVGSGGASGGGNSGIYLDGRLVGEWITGASNNGQIQISNRSVV